MATSQAEYAVVKKTIGLNLEQAARILVQWLLSEECNKKLTVLNALKQASTNYEHTSWLRSFLAETRTPEMTKLVNDAFYGNLTAVQRGKKILNFLDDTKGGWEFSSANTAVVLDLLIGLISASQNREVICIEEGKIVTIFYESETKESLFPKLTDFKRFFSEHLRKKVSEQDLQLSKSATPNHSTAQSSRQPLPSTLIDESAVHFISDSKEPSKSTNETLHILISGNNKLFLYDLDGRAHELEIGGKVADLESKIESYRNAKPIAKKLAETQLFDFIRKNVLFTSVIEGPDIKGDLPVLTGNHINLFMIGKRYKDESDKVVEYYIRYYDAYGNIRQIKTPNISSDLLNIPKMLLQCYLAISLSESKSEQARPTLNSSNHDALRATLLKQQKMLADSTSVTKVIYVDSLELVTNEQKSQLNLVFLTFNEQGACELSRYERKNKCFQNIPVVVDSLLYNMLKRMNRDLYLKNPGNFNSIIKGMGSLFSPEKSGSEITVCKTDEHPHYTERKASATNALACFFNAKVNQNISRTKLGGVPLDASADSDTDSCLASTK